MLLFVYEDSAMARFEERYRIHELTNDVSHVSATDHEKLLQDSTFEAAFVSETGSRRVQNVKIGQTLIDGHGVLWSVSPAPDTPGFITDNFSLKRSKNTIVEWDANSLATSRIKQVQRRTHPARVNGHPAVLVRVKKTWSWQFWKAKPALFQLFSLQDCFGGSEEVRVSSFGSEDLGTIRPFRETCFSKDPQ